MQGIVFVAVHQRLRELGDDELRKRCFPEPGAYVAFRDYPDAELVRIARLVGEAVPALGYSLPDVLRSLGEEVVGTLRQTNPGILPSATSLSELVEQLDANDPRLVAPRMRLVREKDGRATLVHVGDPSVCRFDEGLLIGLGSTPTQRVATRHPSCRARKDAECIFVPRVSSADALRRHSTTFRVDPIVDPTD